ncbi:hypothetical protein LIER_06718 [Lithospermum erythrorhizon]|uniref:Transposase (putative) gypsy type domain-containing protein n=1 Tax=Lithospermum erythrorhizon TaxID=34254 RepID=A0AAV3P9C0_LITER
MDPETLSLARLYTAVGKEFTDAGHLIFSRDHDLFANIAISQDVAQTVASRLNDSDVRENLRDLDVLYVEPLSVCPPSSSTTESPQVHPTPSVSQFASVAQADENTNKSGDPPTIIRDSLPVAFSKEDLINFKQYFSIPPFVEVRLPLEGEQVFESPIDPSQSESALAMRWTAMYIESLSYGARFPFCPFVNDLLIVVNRAIGKIRPTGWLDIIIFIVSCRMAKINPILSLFFNMHTTSHSGPLTSFPTAQ